MLKQLIKEIRRFNLRILFTRGPYLALMAGIDRLVRIVSGHPWYRYGYITPNLIVGGQPGQRAWEYMHELGVTAVINMRSEYDYEIKLESGSIEYMNLPTIDHTAPTIEHLQEGVTFIQEHIENGDKVYLHCWEGLGRGPTMAAAYLVTTGMTPDAAWEKIQESRPFVNPNKEQRARLQEFRQAWEQATV